MIHSNKLSLSICENTLIAGNQFRPISRIEANNLMIALRSDSLNVSQMAIATLCEAVSGIENKRFTWAKVKLYYCCFYAIQSILMGRGYSIFYKNRSPYLILAKQGELPKRQKGNSHSIAIHAFERIFSNDTTLFQPIEGASPLNWLEEKRNEASYRSAPNTDPMVPKEFALVKNSLRNLFQAYADDSDYLYTFDPDHAIMAFPIHLIKSLNNFLIDEFSDQIPLDINPHFRRIFIGAGCSVIDARKLLRAFQF